MGSPSDRQIEAQKKIHPELPDISLKLGEP